MAAVRQIIHEQTEISCVKTDHDYALVRGAEGS